MTHTTSFYPEATNYATMGDNISLITGLIVLLIFLGLCAGAIILQVYLSKRESMWPGLILPIITFSFSLIILFSMVVYTVMPNESAAIRIDTVQLVDVEELSAYEREQMVTREERLAERERYHGELIERHLVDYGTIGRTQIVSYPRIAFILVMFNIPTAIFMAIYAGCRGKRRKQRSLELMSVQDLE